MIGDQLLQLAEEYGMKYDQAVAYGILEGYAATFLDGTGCSRLMLTTRFESNTKKDALMDVINAQDLKNLYGIRKLQIAKKVIHIAFHNSTDANEKIRRFVDWFMPLLEQYGASKADICTQCQEPMAEEDAHWVLRDGAVAFRMHHSCAEELKNSVQSGNHIQASDNGSLLKGILGALTGALLGALLWMLMELIHFYAPISGLAIGWLVVFFYGKLGGKTGKLRLPVLIAASTLSTSFGVFLSAFATASNKSAFFAELGNPELWTSMAEYIALGLVFMALGLFVALKSERRRTTDMVVTDLN